MRFNYQEPKTIAEAVALLGQYGAKARAIAGGTDLLMQIKRKAIRPEQVIDITGIPGLAYLDYDEKAGLRIGALTTVRTLETSALLQQRYPIISQAAGQLGSVAIRNVATVGGNLCNAAPSAESAPALLALSARIRIIGPQGERIVPLEEFFTGPGANALQSAELMVEIQVPPLPPNTKGVYLKHSIRGTVDLAIVSVAVIAGFETDGRYQDVKVALGAVAPTPIRAHRVEEALKNRKPGESLIDSAAQLAAEEASPVSDVRASAQYRREMVRVLTRRALREISLPPIERMKPSRERV